MKDERANKENEVKLINTALLSFLLLVGLSSLSFLCSAQSSSGRKKIIMLFFF